MMSKKLTLGDCHAVAAERGGRCLSTKYVDSKTHMQWQCGECDHIWSAVFGHIKRGRWCPKCGKVAATAVATKNRLTLEDCQKVAKKKGGKCLSHRYVNSHSHMQWKCGKCNHIWNAAFNHIKRSGWCPICRRSRRHQRKTLDAFIKRAKQVHGDKYDYSETEYITARSKVVIICPTHGRFIQTASNHYYNDCPTCAHFDSPEEFVKKANSVHNYKYDYSKSVYKHSRIKILIICPIHGLFWQRPMGHLRGKGCPKCSCKTQSFIASVCSELFPNCIVEYNYKKLNWLRSDKGALMELDIFIPEIGLAIEYDGEQHFYPVKFGGMNQDEAKEKFVIQQRRDKLKNKLIAENQQDVNIFIRFSYKETITKASVEDKITRAVFLS